VFWKSCGPTWIPLKHASFLGRGQFGTVHLVLDKEMKNFALKVLKGNVITLNGWEKMVQNERDAMLELSSSESPFICKLFNYFSDRRISTFC
jgi:serine/threonine protein kinase